MGERVQRRVACGGAATRIACLWIACASIACGATAEDTSRNGVRGAGMGGGGAFGNAGAAASAGTAGTNGFGNPEMSDPIAGTGQTINMPPDDVCESIRITADPQIPDMLIVLDRSGSMTEGGRWTPSVSALRNVTQQLQSQIRFGLAMFPAPPPDINTVLGGLGGCLTATDPQACIDMINAAACAPGGIITPVAIDNAGAIDMALNMTMPAGGTPTGETLEGLVQMYGSRPQNPDEPQAVQYILLVTDGQPTCPAGMGSMVTQPDIDRSNAAIDALAMMGVNTYVIGYDTNTPGNEALAQVLDGFAQRGGTGDTMHHPVEDEASLLMVLQGIASELVSCTFTLEEAPARADFVLVQVDGAQINLGDADGWELVGDRTVEVRGAACEKLRSGGTHSVDVQVTCAIVPPQ